LLLLSGAERLFSQLEIPDPYGTVASSVNFLPNDVGYLAHIGNDWLAVPIAVWALVALNVLGKSPGVVLLPCSGSPRSRLLTKAYFSPSCRVSRPVRSAKALA